MSNSTDVLISQLISPDKIAYLKIFHCPDEKVLGDPRPTMRNLSVIYTLDEGMGDPHGWTNDSLFDNQDAYSDPIPLIEEQAEVKLRLYQNKDTGAVLHVEPDDTSTGTGLVWVGYAFVMPDRLKKWNRRFDSIDAVKEIIRDEVSDFNLFQTGKIYRYEFSYVDENDPTNNSHDLCEPDYMCAANVSDIHYEIGTDDYVLVDPKDLSTSSIAESGGTKPMESIGMNYD